jgi:hypothetical protein
MKKHGLLWLAPVLMLAAFFAGCANDDGGSVDEGITGSVIMPKDSTSFRVSPARISLAKGTKQQFKAYYNGKEVSLVEWSVSGSAGSSKFGTDNISTSELEVSLNETAGVLNVSATLTSNGKKFTAQALVTVLGNGDVPLEHGLTVSPGVVVVGKGFSQTFTASLSASGDAASGVSWTVTGGGSGTEITNGILTVAAGETAKKLLVTASLNADKYGTAIVYVGSAPEGSGPFPENHGIEVKLPNVTLDKGEQGSFTALGTNLGSVTWSLAGNKVATTITAGTFTVAPAETAEKIAVKAASGEKWGQAVVTVRGNDGPPPYGPVVDGLLLEPQEVSVAKGGTQTFTVKVYVGDVSWTVRGGKSGTAVSGGVLTVASGETAKYLVVRAEASDGKNGTAVVTVTEGGGGSGETAATLYTDPGTGTNGGKSLKQEFEITSTGAQAVTDTFNAVSTFIENGGLTSSQTRIALGDYIDLEGGLSVTAYDSTNGSKPNYTGGFSISAADGSKAIPGLTGAEYNDGYKGCLLRLIVVGINSFLTHDTYTAPAANNKDHVVFQFQNIPVKRRMNPSYPDSGGYAGSEMREYLTPVDEKTGSGKFLAGLTEAGVPEAVLWAPTRYIANGCDGATGADTITDKLWLPTEREMFKGRSRSNRIIETTSNQPFFNYYTSYATAVFINNVTRLKYLSTGSATRYGYGTMYWTASPSSDGPSGFCSVHSQGVPHVYVSSDPSGVAPAFCVAY